METIAFYSYKGGVGRSLLVANAARFLGMVGKRVVALDLDIEAPGLHYKLGRTHEFASRSSMIGGAVPYLVATAKSAKNPPPLRNHMVELALPDDTDGWFQLMPAGPAPRREYWTALKKLRECLRFDDPSGKGLAALLDLHARIQEELKPDYLLIDARTGVTELGGLAATALADCVVCLFVANQESIDGTLAIVEALLSSERILSAKKPRVLPIIARATELIGGEGRAAAGMRRLVEIGDVRENIKKGEAIPLMLPHDSVLGATDKVVGGEQKASAFSPLHKAYLEVFQHIFPQQRKKAEEVLQRLQAVAELKERLVARKRGRFGTPGAFDPWDDSAIEEGVMLQTSSAEKPRYADLVCRDKDGEVLMIVEYVPKEKEAEARECWNQQDSAGCLILLCQSPKELWVEKNIYSRSEDGEDFQESKRHDPPFPMEFDIYSDPGNPTIDESMEALHQGIEDLIPDMISQWQECMVAMDIRKHGPRWRPMEARKILDGLAATDKIDVAERILRYAADRSSFSIAFEEYHGRHGGGGLNSMRENDLFAPLLWRLPVEATIKYLSKVDHPFHRLPCLNGHQLLAEQIMGLRYDPLGNALKEYDFIGSQIPERNSDSDHEDHTALDLIYRHLFSRKRPRLSDAPPPLLLWDQQLRREPYWSGEWEDISKEALEKARKVMGETSRLQVWLSDRIAKGALATRNLLGRYDPASCRIELYPAMIEALAPILGLQPRYLKSVIFIQLSVFAIAHQARDFDGQPGYGFAVDSPKSPFQKESPALITLTQYFTFRLIERLGDINLMGAFEKLSEKQPEPYRRWRRMRHTPLEQMRIALLRARLGESALELPGAELDG